MISFKLSRVTHPDVKVRDGRCHSDMKPFGDDLVLLLLFSAPPHTATQLPFVVIDETHKLVPLFQGDEKLFINDLFCEYDFTNTFFLSKVFWMLNISIDFLSFPSQKPLGCIRGGVNLEETQRGIRTNST